MANITFNNVYASLKKGSTWGTEVIVTSGINLYASAITLSGGFADFLTRDFGQGGKRTNNARLANTSDVTITCDLTYGQGWMTLLSGFLGTESVPAETTVGESDYGGNFDMADSTNGLFWTLAYLIETDRVMVIPSLKVVSCTITIDINGAGSVSFQCMADRIIESSTSTAANVSGNTAYPHETATYGGTNHYFRIHDYSTGSSLSSTHDKEISGFVINMARPHQRRYGLRGANTAYTLEPLQLGPIDATCQVKFTELQNSSYDIFGDWLSPGFKMAEAFIDGSAINAGVNRSFKLQLPYLKIKGQLPPGHDVQSNNGLFLPQATYDMLKAAAAPSGMSGVTDLIRVVAKWEDRTAKWQA